jgi:hypothetical protein
MSPNLVLLLYFLITVPIAVAGVWFVRRLLVKHNNWKGPMFAPTTPKDSRYGYGFVTLAGLMTIVVMGMNAFDLAYPWIRPISEIASYNGSYAELSVTLLVLSGFVVARYISYLRVLFFSFLLVFLLLIFLFGRDVANVQWDTSEPAQFIGTIVDKKISTGGRKSASPADYSLHVKVNASGSTFDIPVSSEIWQVAMVGDSLSVETREGFFKKRWASGKVVVLKKARN